MSIISPNQDLADDLVIEDGEKSNSQMKISVQVYKRGLGNQSPAQVYKYFDDIKILEKWPWLKLFVALSWHERGEMRLQSPRAAECDNRRNRFTHFPKSVHEVEYVITRPPTDYVNTFPK